MAGNQAYFANKPNINIGRTRWNMEFDHPTSFQHGKVIPLECTPILPGDSIKLKLSSLIRMNQPIVPIMDNIKAHVYAFFVPMRLVWDHTKEFFGENEETAGPQLTPYKIPTKLFGNDVCEAGSISHYLHKPIVADGSEWDDPLKVACLKERAYYVVWNTYFRAQQFTDPVSICKDDGNVTNFEICNKVTGTNATQQFFGDYVGKWNSKPLPCAKQFDYFTAATLMPQYGPTIEIPLGDYAPLGVLTDTGYEAPYFPEEYDKDSGEWHDGVNSGSNPNLFFGAKTMDQGYGYPLFSGDDSSLSLSPNTKLDTEDLTVISQGKDNGSFETNLIVNLSKATAASINTLRAAFAAQRFYERSIYGTRYNEYIQVHYGVTPPMGLLQYPELLGEHHWNINIQQVLSTAGATDDDNTRLGQPGANSTTGDSAVIFRKSFVEHGFLFVILTTTHDRHYTQGFLREDLKTEMLEIYHPEFATLGDQAIYRNEIVAKDGRKNDDVFGYQEHWAEYRYRPSRASGVLDPASGSGMSMWTLTDLLDDDVVLGNSFIYESREALASSLVTGTSSSYDYIGDFYFDYDIIRPMPLYSIPGRLDHVGGW